MQNLKKFQKNLLDWYWKNARKLPWRETKDPYKIWVSEIMLQQTQVATVIDYYKRWLKRFPTLKSLAGAKESEVMKYWAGLGYYRRARMLHGGAKLVLSQYDGKLPAGITELQKIPGIGRYTAGAISSIAFDLPAPILDGNVIRVLSRVNALKENVQSAKAKSHLWELAEKILPLKHIGDFNQALMELGATVCVPDNPKCPACPVKNHCLAFAKGNPEKYPVQNRREKIQKLNRLALIFCHQGKTLIQRQASHERWGGLWIFPQFETKKEFAKSYKGIALPQKPACHIRHSFTKYQIRLSVYCVKTPPPRLQRGQVWVPILSLPQYAFPSPYKKISEFVIQNLATQDLSCVE